jgi:L-histidine N-alpha-methyltransferase
MSVSETIQVETYLREGDSEATLKEIRAALGRSPRQVPTRFLYDDRGSRLFEQITELPEYYPTRTEAAILTACADDIIERTGAEELIELGSGSSTKTRILLDAMARAGSLAHYVPVDVSEAIMVDAAEDLVAEYPGLTVRAVVADFITDMAHISDDEHQLYVFLGGTIGNFKPQEAGAFLERLGSEMQPGSYLLLGTDLIKSPERLFAAYNDSQGVTAAFNKNILAVMNRILESEFDLDAFEHHAPWNAEQHRIEMWLRSTRAQSIPLPALDMTLDLAEGESLLTEMSVKYDRPKVEALLERGGYAMEAWYTDSERLFALSLARRM